MLRNKFVFKFLTITFMLSMVFISARTMADYVWTEHKINASRAWSSITSSADGTKLAACVDGDADSGYIYTSQDGGDTWTERTNAGSKDWSSIASSADGMKLAACVDSGYIYTSQDGGVTWIERASAGSRYWSSIASSADGTKLAACVDHGYIYTSQDGGVTWIERASAGSRYWSSITSSSDGMKLAACVDYSGYIYTSQDGGATWTERTNAGSNYWCSITSSSDGMKLAACVDYSGYIYTSQDGGATWTERTNVGKRYWSSITSSSDGMKLAACVDYSGYIYTSQDGGATWTERTNTGSRNWGSITSSADGMKIMVCGGYYGFIYTSIDAGTTWTIKAVYGAKNWSSVASSNDGTKLAACVDNGYIYTSQDGGATWTERTNAGSRAWSSITSSSDGMKLAACVDDYGYIYTSQDGGATWTERTTVGERYWSSIASSSDGTKLAACSDAGRYIYISADGGDTWTERTNAGSRNWISIVSSSDGMKLAVCTDGGYIYTSQDGGATWTERINAGSEYWSSITSSSDGMKLAACNGHYSGYIYISQDGGDTWIGRTNAGSKYWSSITSSSDGMKLTACVGNDSYNGYIYTSQDGGVTWTERTTAGNRYWSSITSSSDGMKLAACAINGYIFTGIYIPPPQVSTTNVSDITATTAVSGGSAVADGGAVVTSKGVCWNTSSNPTISSSKTDEGAGAGNYISNITGLLSDKTYYMRAYAKGIDDIVYGEESIFTTDIATPTVTTASVTSITTTTAVSGGNVTSDGGASVTARGVCWSTSANPTTADNKTTNSTVTGSFTSNITGLTPNTLYHVRAYATNSKGTSYGEDKIFTTNPITAPTVTIASVTSITTTTAISGGNVTSDGGASVTARGVCWSTLANPTTADNKTTDGTGTGSFTSNITGLTPNTLYHVRAYATNNNSTAYGNNYIFTTRDNSTNNNSTWEESSLTLSSSVNSVNSMAGFNGCLYAGTTKAQLWNSSNGSSWAQCNTNGFGDISNTSIESLAAYSGYIWAGTYQQFDNTFQEAAELWYSNNGISWNCFSDYDDSFNFENSFCSMVVSNNYLFMGTNDNYGANMERILCNAPNDFDIKYQYNNGWGDSRNIAAYALAKYEDESTHLIFAGTGNQATASQIYMADVDDLIWEYLDDGGFGNINNVIVMSLAVFNGYLYASTSNEITGGELWRAKLDNLYSWEKCIEYGFGNSNNSIIKSLYVFDDCLYAGTRNEAEGAEVWRSANGLSWERCNENGFGNTNIIAVNCFHEFNDKLYVGTTNKNGAGKIFIFENLALSATVTASVTSITTTTAVSGGNITSDGGASVTARGVCWSTSANPTTADSKTTNGTGTGSFTSNLTGLIPNTLYHVRAYAINSQGVSYGNDRSFTTGIVSNLASLSDVTVTASSYYNGNFSTDKANDGIYGAWDEYEWASSGEMAPWIDFKWSTAQTINKVVFYDRCNPIDHISDAWMYLKKNGSVVKAIHVGMFPFGGSAKEVIFDPINIDEIYLDITDGWGLNVGLSEMQVFYDPTIETETNLVASANVTASSYYNNAYNPNMAKDGIYGAWDEYEWASKGEMAPWIDFRWNEPHTINKVVLYDRCNPVDHIEDAWLYLKNSGNTVKAIHIGMFPFGGSAKEIIFDPVNVDEIFLDIVDGWGLNVGLSEIQAFYDPSLETTVNLTNSAVVTASSYYNDNFSPNKANDGIYGAWDEYEWASSGEMAPWINFKWSTAHTINKVVLYDRCNPVDHISDAWMYFKKNGSVVKAIHVGMFPYGGAAKEINFDPISIDEIFLDITDGWGLNVGLSEIQVFEEE